MHLISRVGPLEATMDLLEQTGVHTKLRIRVRVRVRVVIG